MKTLASVAYPSPAIYEENELHTRNVHHYTLASSRESLLLAVYTWTLHVRY
jgi:hypothetical protein